MGSCCWTRDHRLSTLSTWSESLLKMADIFNISSDPVGPHQELQEEPSEGSHHHLHQGLLHHPGQKRFHWTRPNQEYFPTSHPLIQDLHSSQWSLSTPISILTTSPPPVPLVSTPGPALCPWAPQACSDPLHPQPSRPAQPSPSARELDWTSGGHLHFE